MIYIRLGLFNPLQHKWQCVWSKTGPLLTNKAWEVNFYRNSCIAKVDCQISTTGDHAGIRMSVGVFGREIELVFYDVRHWDHDQGTWAN